MRRHWDLKVEHLGISTLKPYARNARTHTNKQIRQIAASIETFGWTNPILIDQDRQVVAGHGRLAAARLLGLEEIPAIRLSGLTEAQVRAYVIADNRLAELAGSQISGRRKMKSCSCWTVTAFLLRRGT